MSIDTLPSNGQLTLGGTPVAAGQQIPLADVGSLAYAGDPGVADSFTWNGSDSLAFAATDATVWLQPYNPVVSVTADQPDAVAATGVPGDFTFSLDSPAPQSLTIGFALDGTAVNGLSYQTVSEWATIPAGGTSTTVEISIPSLMALARIPNR